MTNPIQIGAKFGLLTVLAPTPDRPPTWLCQCSCGSAPLPRLGRSLRSGGTRSCGCLTRTNPAAKTHGLSRHAAYASYRTAKTRLGPDFQLPPFPDAWVVLGPTWTPGSSLSRHDPRIPMTLGNVCWVSKGFAKAHNATVTAKVKAEADAKREIERIANLERRKAQLRAQGLTV